MLKFDLSKLTVQIVQLKTVTTALGGSITFVDETRSTPKKEVYGRMSVPANVARSFFMRTKKVSRYLKPVYTAVLKYDDHVVDLERHPLAALGALEEEGLDGQLRRWTPQIERNIQAAVETRARGDREWYFDGRYMYSFKTDVDQAIRAGEFLSVDGRFRKVLVDTVDLSLMHRSDLSGVDGNESATAERSTLAYVSGRGITAVSPPIWKNLSDVGKTKLDKPEADDALEDDEDDDLVAEDAVKPIVYNFDEIDRTMSVNLNFALKAGELIGKTFGYEHVEPLQLPRLMIELHTVNLPNVPKQVKQTYAVGIQFTHALAWLLGMSRRANTLETHLMMRSLMKYLTRRGIFRNNTFDAEHVLKAGKSIGDVKAIPLADLLTMETEVSLAAIIEQARLGAKARKKNDQDISQIGGLLNEE